MINQVLICWKDSLTIFLSQNFIPFLKNVLSTSIKTYRTLIIYFWWFIGLWFAVYLIRLAFLTKFSQILYKSSILLYSSTILEFLNSALPLLFMFIIITASSSKKSVGFTDINIILRNALMIGFVTALLIYLIVRLSGLLGMILDIFLRFLPFPKYFSSRSVFGLSGLFFIYPIPFEELPIFKKFLYQFPFKESLALLVSYLFYSPFYLFLNFAILKNSIRKIISSFTSTCSMIIYSYPINFLVNMFFYIFINLLFGAKIYSFTLLFTLYPFIASFMYELYKRNLKIIS